MNKKILFLIVLIIIVSLSVVSATENHTKDTSNVIQKTSKDTTAMIKTETKNTNKTKVNIKTNNVKGVIGENITLKASVTDEKGKKVSGGNLVFKLNGKSLRTDKKFNSNAKALKIPVKNGTASVTITADAYLRNTKNLAASYSGTSKYEETQSGVTTVQIQKRRANITVRADKTISHGETLTIIAVVKDANLYYKNKTAIYENTSVIFKINGRTINNNGKIYYKISQDNIALCNYTIPEDMGSIDKNRQIRNYTITAIMVGDNYYPNTRNTTNFTVNRNKMEVNINKLHIGSFTNLENKISHYLEIEGSLYEIQPDIAFHYDEYYYYDSIKHVDIKGKSKACIKINGKTVLDENAKAKYWDIQDGHIDISMRIPDNTIIKRVMIVIGERQAYPECKLETNITTSMLAFQPEVYYIYNKQKKMLQICNVYVEDDKVVYKSFYDTKNLPLYISQLSTGYIDMFEGTFSFYDEKGFIGNGKYVPSTDYNDIIECPYKYDGKDHEIKVKYSYPNTHYFDIQYNITIRSADSLDAIKMLRYFASNTAPESIQNNRPMEFLPNYMDEFAIQTTFKYNKFSLTLNNKTQTFTNMDKKSDSYGYFDFNLTLPSKYGKYNIKLVFYDKNNKVLLEKNVPIIIKNVLNKSYYKFVKNTVFPLNHNQSYYIEKNTECCTERISLKYKTLKVSFNNKTTTYNYSDKNGYYVEITTPSKPGNYTLNYTFYNQKNQKMDTNNIVLEVYKYTPKLLIFFENNGVEEIYLNNTNLKCYQSIFKSGSKFNVSFQVDQTTNQVHDFYESFMIRVIFKNIKTNEIFVKYKYDTEFEAPNVKGDYKMVVDLLGGEKLSDTNLITANITVI